MTILLLAGGNSNEREVSLRSGNVVEAALKTAGYEVKRADPADLGFELEPLCQNVDVVFLALHGQGGEDGTLQAQLEKLGKKFVGSGSQASALCMNKWRYKQLLKQDDILVSQGKIVSLEDLKDPMFQKPFVLKPIDGGSTIDMVIGREINDTTILKAKEQLQKYPQMLLEELIEGDEITLGVLVDQALPVIEIIPPSGQEFDYENKYNGATQEICPPINVSGSIQKQAQELALKIHKLTGCKDMSRTDMIVDKNEKLHVLETNTIPGLTDQSLLPKAAKVAGISMVELVKKLVESA